MNTLEQYSSFQIGKMLNVSRQAVNQWIDKGYMNSYRTPGGHRRVRKESLLDFLHERKMPVPSGLMENRDDSNLGMRAPVIYLVDDDTSFLLGMEHVFSQQISHGEIVSYGNGYDALVAIGARTPDLLVMDLKISGLNGAEIVRHLQNNEMTRSLPIVVVTECDITPQWRSSILQMGVEAIYTKELPVAQIGEQITAFLDRHNGYNIINN